MAKNNRTRRTVRQSRALGIALTPKAEKYLERRPYGPGQHGRARKKADSNYATQLKEKQRLRAQYNIREAQMRRAYLEAKRVEGQTLRPVLTLWFCVRALLAPLHRLVRWLYTVTLWLTVCAWIVLRSVLSPAS